MIYDAAAAIVFAPLDGLTRLRTSAVDLLNIVPGTRVLELGCGTGGITAMLVERGAIVTGVDQSRRALHVAARRAPTANFVEADLATFAPANAEYDRVLLAFVLHELRPETRLSLLRRTGTTVAGEGSVAVLDWAVAEAKWVQMWIGMFVSGFEPPSARSWLMAPAETHLSNAGFVTRSAYRLARGAARLVVATPRA